MSGTTGGRKGVPADALLALGIVGVVGIMLMPLPVPLLDGLLAINVAVALLLLLVALGVEKPLEFSVFPSLLLIVTLFRISLNVATTRIILLDGSEGPGAAGHVIEAFGRFAIGGSLIVGAVVFLILLVVNFAVITKGSGRVSEVAARFTLDALPGKQMSIDADLAAGLIDEQAARARRSSLERETEFFGAMDGANKFVRGDAIAGLLITGVNIVGGLIAGVFRDGLSLAQAAETFSLLAIGDGLVSQIPALLVSVAAGILVTRATGGALGSQIGGQLFGSGRPLRLAALVLGGVALVPGMPTVAFAALGVGMWLLSSRALKQKAQPQQKEATPEQKGPERMSDLLALDQVELEVGFGLLPLIDVDKGGELPGRVTGLRRQIAQDLGLILPSVHLKDNLRLEPNDYRIRLRGEEVARGVIHPDRLLCLSPQGGAPDVPGVPGKEPAFGLPAMWVLPQDRAAAEVRGYTLVDPTSVIATHLGEVLRHNAHELLGRQEVQELLGNCAKEAPKLVEEAVPGAVSLGELGRVLRGLLREGVPVRDLRTILEAVADAAPRSKDTVFLVEQSRRRLSRQITARVAQDGVVHAVTLERTTEEMLRASLAQSDGEPVLAPDLEIARRLMGSLENAAAQLSSAGQPVVIVAPADLRRPLFDFANRFIPDLHVVTARELVPGTTLQPAAVLDVSALRRAA